MAADVLQVHNVAAGSASNFRCMSKQFACFSTAVMLFISKAQWLQSVFWGHLYESNAMLPMLNLIIGSNFAPYVSCLHACQ